jgi:hypothetical protein
MLRTIFSFFVNFFSKMLIDSVKTWIVIENTILVLDSVKAIDLLNVRVVQNLDLLSLGS